MNHKAHNSGNVLITGVAGLMGSRLATWIIDNTEFNVIGIDDLSGGYIENVDSRKDRCKFYKIDLANQQEALDRVFCENSIDIIYHLAAYAAEGLSPFIRNFNYKNNLIASTSLINCAIKYSIERFVFTSSMAVYGEQKTPFHEDMIPMPIDPYGVAKYAIEMDLKIAHDHHGLKYTVVRPHNFYGRNQNIWDKYRNVLGIWMYQIKQGTRPVIYGDGEQTRAFSYVDDSLFPMWNASQNDDCIGQIINLGGTKETTINDACNILMSVVGTDLKPVYLENRYEVRHAYATWEKSERLLGYKHVTSLREGIGRMWDWAKDQPDRKQFIWENYEIEKGVYEFWKNKHE